MDFNKYGYNGFDPKPQFNTKFYKGEDLYSDGDIEDEVIKIIAKNETTDYERYINENYSWPVFYHLTRIRQNLLNWYPFNEDADVLEIGCGMGAITELLCKKCSNVTAVELSKRRATATYLRCRAYENLEIIVGNLNDIEFDKKYDYITLIGVLEYQNNYTSSENPFKDFLVKIKKLLKPDGKLLIAIENKYGLKYWCGAPEDHSGIPFDGINDYKYSNIARTFSKKQLENIIKQSGFDKTFFYYPLPDYKMPQVIYSDDYLPLNGSVDNWIPYYQPNNKSMISDEEHLYKDLVDNGVFEFFANSFLVECTGTNIEVGRVSYAVDSPFRKAKYSLITAFSKEKGFYKKAEDVSRSLLYQIKANHDDIANHGINICKTQVDGNILYIERATGKPFTDILIEAYDSGNKEKIYGLWDRIYDEIKRSSETANELSTNSDFANTPKLNHDDKIMLNAYIDMIHKNCFIDEEGKFKWIDQEWCVKNIPASYLLYYNILELYMSNRYLNTIVSFDEVMEYYGLKDNVDYYTVIREQIMNEIFDGYICSNYAKLSKNDNKAIADNVTMLYRSMTEIKLNEVECKVNEVIDKYGIKGMIEYVSSLSNDSILNNIPAVPQFIVRYLKSSEKEKRIIENQVTSYQDIKEQI